MEESKMRWEDPKMLELDALSEVMGHCAGGGTATASGEAGCQTGGVPDTVTPPPIIQECHTGEFTAAGGGNAHWCNSGGFAGTLFGGCTSGGTVG